MQLSAAGGRDGAALAQIPLLALLVPLVTLGLAGGCPGEDTRCVVGDPSQPIEIEVILRQPDGTYAVAQEGAAAPLQMPPQLGKVIYPGVRAKNLDVCAGVQLTTALRDECQNLTLSVEDRPVRLRATAGGWAEPAQPEEISDYGNLPVCPRAAASRDLHGEPYLLVVNVRDKAGRSAEKRLHVVPTCAEPGLASECRCECSRGYEPGDTCSGTVDGGPSGCPSDAGP